MATKRQRSNGTWEYCFQRKGLLQSRVYFTFDTEAQGDAYAERAEALLDRGIIPTEFTGTALRTLADLCRHYEASATYSKSDADLIETLTKALESTAMTSLTYNWVEGWVDSMKTSLKPSTLTKRVGLLARVVDWAMRKEMINLPNNPVRLLPRGYATKGQDRSKQWDGERTRRLEADEEARLLKVLKPEELVLVQMALETAMRLSEMLTLTLDQIDLDRRTIFLDKTKNGSKRQVPMTTVLHKLLTSHKATLPEEATHLFSWGLLPAETARLRVSHLFAYRVRKAKIEGFRFHDLRHTATARLYERTSLTDVEIASITGHKDPRMLKRYANLRASTLATKLW